MSRMILKILSVLAFRTVEISMSQCSTWGSHRSEERRVGKECRSGWSPNQ